jgi:hypothetical protein
MVERQDSNGQTSSTERGRLGLPLHIEAALQSRMQLASRLGTLFDGRRNLHQLLGYKDVLVYRDFKARYLRQHIAHRIVRYFPEATWARPPSVDEDNQQEEDTPFEAAWKALDARLHVMAILQRTDMLANLGRYACLLIGLKGQPDLSQPIERVRTPDDVIYLAPYSEEFALVTELEKNTESPRFGQPLYYTFQFSRGSTLGAPGAAVPSPGGRVHASRVIHVAEDLLDDEVYGVPRLEPIYDLLDDLYKVQGGAAEMWWTDSKRRLVFALRDDAKMSKDDEKALTEEVEEFVHELRSFVRVSGIDVSALMGTIDSPKEHIDGIITFIATTLGIPRRKLEGTERGSLASSQDEAGALQQVQLRQVGFAERQMLRPLLDTLITINALPMPAQPYTVNWDNLLALSEEQQAAVAKDVATALSQYAGQGMAETVVPPEEFRSVYLGLKEVSDFAIPELEPPAPTAPAAVPEDL